MKEIRAYYTHSTPPPDIDILALKYPLQLPTPNPLQAREVLHTLSIFTQSRYSRLTSPAPNGIGWHCEVSTTTYHHHFL